MAESYRFKLYETTMDLNKVVNSINEIPFNTIAFENGESIQNVRVNEAIYGHLGTLSLIKEIDFNNRIVKTKTVTSREIEFMPPAPADYEIQIDLAGVGYIAGDMLPCSLEGYNIVVLDVDENGGIISAKITEDPISHVPTGYGAMIDAVPVYYVGHEKQWVKLPKDKLGSNSSALVEYESGKPYKENTLLFYDGILYRASNDFVSSNDSTEVLENLKKDVLLGMLQRMTPEDVPVPECLGTFMSDSPTDLPTDVVKGNWGLVLDCVNTAPNQPRYCIIYWNRLEYYSNTARRNAISRTKKRWKFKL